jgi:hypothetical protein
VNNETIGVEITRCLSSMEVRLVSSA